MSCSRARCIGLTVTLTECYLLIWASTLCHATEPLNADTAAWCVGKPHIHEVDGWMEQPTLIGYWLDRITCFVQLISAHDVTKSWKAGHVCPTSACWVQKCWLGDELALLWKFWIVFFLNKVEEKKERKKTVVAVNVCGSYLNAFSSLYTNSNITDDVIVM